MIGRTCRRAAGGDDEVGRLAWPRPARLTAPGRVSSTWTVSTRSTPRRASQPGSCGPRLSRTRPSLAGPSARISSPRTRSRTIGRRRTETVSCPPAAASPIRAGVMIEPAWISTSPARASSPARRTSPPERTRPRTDPSWSMRPSSLRRTPSQPSGSAAPVAIRTAWPATRGVGQTAPASTWPMTTHGLSPATAQPSIAEIAEGGSGVSAFTSSVVMSPCASMRRTCSVGSRSTHACAICTSLVPARLDVRHQPTFSQPRFGAWLPASCGPRSR